MIHAAITKVFNQKTLVFQKYLTINSRIVTNDEFGTLKEPFFQN